jgi:hypothetical protein
VELHTKLTTPITNPEPNPTPQPATNSVTGNPNWDGFSVQTGSFGTATSSQIDNPGVSPSPPSGSPVTAPHTNDPALIITTADARQTVQWPDGSYKPYPVNLTAENLAYGTGPLYANAGGFGSNENSGGTGPGQTYNTNSFAPGVGFPLIKNNSPYAR